MSESALSSPLSRVRIVLVEPAGALNVGSIARVMKNMGLRHLVIVNPQCDILSDQARLMAVHAADLLEQATIVSTIPEALQGCHRAIATTARPRSIETPLEVPRVALPWLVETPEMEYSALMFGSEEHGLSNEALNYAQRFVCIPSSAEYASLNLAQAVAVCCYELYQHLQNQHLPQPISAERNSVGTAPESIGTSIGTGATSFSLPQTEVPAAIDTLNGYYQHLETVLLQIGYLYPHTATSRMEKFRRMFNRALLSDAEVALLRGILRQVEWAAKTGMRDEG